MQLIWAVARNTYGDSVRKRVVLVFQVLAIVMLLLALLLRHFTVSDRDDLFTSTQLIIVLIFGGLIAITTSVFLVPTEMDTRTIYTVLSKPIQRFHFFVGKWLGAVLTVSVMVGVMLLSLILILFVLSVLPSPSGAFNDLGSAAHQGGGLGAAVFELPQILIGGSLILFQLIVVTGIAATLSLILTTTVNFAMTTFLWIVGSLQWVVLALANRNEQGFVLVPYLLKAVYYLTPHFNDINYLAGFGQMEVAPKMGPLQFAGLVSGYHLIYLAVVLLIGVVLFERKEM